jgi:hypothetical protein
MITSNSVKSVEFIDRDEDFIKKLAGDIGCHYCRANERTYKLNKFASDIPSKMGAFAWVHKEGNDCFWISTRKIWLEEARAKAMESRRKSEANCFTRDTQQADDSVKLNTQVDYEKTVSILRQITKII